MYNKINRPAQNEMRINLKEKNAVEYWTRTFGISKKDLEKAVNTAGIGVEGVKSYLREKSLITV